jgi:uncharacterized protein YegL/ribosomal protein L40E
MKCPDPKCNTANSSTAKFCKKCGHDLKSPAPSTVTPTAVTGYTCSGCGEVNPPGAVFCRNCGIPVSQKPAPAATATAYPFASANIQQGASAKDLLNQIEVASPEQPHCATLLLLDTSGSMVESRKIDQLNEGLRFLREEILKDELASSRVDIAVVTFGDGAVKAVHPFTSIQDFQPPLLSANGDTPMGEAILQGIDFIEKRKKIYRDQGVNYYRPWIFMITDGEPTDMKQGDQKWAMVKNTIEECERNGKLMFFSVGVEPANMTLLNDIMPPSRGPIKLRQGNFREMFQWLSNSQEKIVRSDIGPGEMVKLEAPTGWGEVPAK